MTRTFLTLALLVQSFAVLAQASGEEHYLRECSKCHGLMKSEVGARRGPPLLRVAEGGIHRVALTDGQATPRRTAGAKGWSGAHLAFALPYGPALDGVLGREAGSVQGYDYSQAFLDAFSGVVWNEQRLDEYITSSQLQAPGARMFYKQPDAGIRRAIIDFLSRTR